MTVARMTFLVQSASSSWYSSNLKLPSIHQPEIPYKSNERREDFIFGLEKVIIEDRQVSHGMDVTISPKDLYIKNAMCL